MHEANKACQFLPMLDATETTRAHNFWPVLATLTTFDAGQWTMPKIPMLPCATIEQASLLLKFAEASTSSRVVATLVENCSKVVQKGRVNLISKFRQMLEAMYKPNKDV